ncbi:MAG: DUF192 domain-containing protein [Pseudomonadales bacterium]
MYQARLSFTDDEQLGIDVFVTQTFRERNRGLFALAQLQCAQGLLITPCRSVHTFGMGYAIDLVYLNRDFQIVKLVHDMGPNRMSLALCAKMTLELKAGEIKRLQLTNGQQGQLQQTAGRET